jgi:hypothetical protein
MKSPRKYRDELVRLLAIIDQIIAGYEDTAVSRCSLNSQLRADSLNGLYEMRRDLEMKVCVKSLKRIF